MARAGNSDRNGVARAFRGIVRLALVLGVFAGAVWGVAFLLDSQKSPAANACVAALPDGTRYALGGEQTRNAALISAVALDRGLPARAVTIALATAMQESRLINIDYGDRDSLGLFQQRPSQGWGTEEQVTDPFYSANAFYDGLLKVNGWETLEVTVAAQAVQRSAFPNAYAQHEGMARAFASALTGHSPAELACDVPEDERAGDPADAPPSGDENAAGGAPPSGDENAAGGAPPSGYTAGGAEPLLPLFSGLDDFGIAPPLSPALDSSGAVVKAPSGRVLSTLDAAALTGLEDPARASWAAAHWLVATASESTVTTVVVGDLLWRNGSLAWEPAGKLAQPENTVLVG
nr:hypothetical protein [Actinomycetales bacterium]